LIKNLKFKIENLRSKRAFSLPEVIVSMFIFVLMMLTVTSVFVVLVKMRKEAREMQRNMESIRYAVELMAKNIRMSRVDNSSEGTDNKIFIYNNSQEKCMEFYFSEPNIMMKEKLTASSDNCSSIDLGNGINLTNFDANQIEGLKFYYDKFESTSLGYVTISVQMTGTQESAQTTVALRNYTNLGN
jgi:Tfp pilus assembly protein PilV